jgi:membrane protease YdiL (CAAX protease family)
MWLEVAAVLAVAVVPHLVGAITSLYQPNLPPVPYWLDSFSLTVLSGCTIFVTLYLIHRSGEPWDRFGVTRPSVGDAVVGVLLLMVAEMIGRMMPDLSSGTEPRSNWFPQRQTGIDLGLMVAKYGVAAFAEELVTRAYLITRLSVLLRSRGEAVLVAAALFASYHLYQGINGVTFCLVLGVAYGVAFLLTGRVWPLAFGHALYNTRLDLLAA